MRGLVYGMFAVFYICLGGTAGYLFGSHRSRPAVVAPVARSIYQTPSGLPPADGGAYRYMHSWDLPSIEQIVACPKGTTQCTVYDVIAEHPEDAAHGR
jgi:hypothetical protein